MIRKKHFLTIFAALALVVTLAVVVLGRAKNSAVSEPADPVMNPGPASAAESAGQPEAEIEPGRQDGERFEDIIILEGMEETVQYEHVRNDVLGFEMDYDYENFVRQSEPDCERFVSNWDDPGNPENYLEVRFSPLDAETAAAAIIGALSDDYEVRREDSLPLGRAGTCIRIDADEIKGGGYMPDLLQTVYVVPASDGCRVATANSVIVESEGFLRRFRYMMNTFSPTTGSGSLSVPGAWQTASIGYEDNGTVQPEYYVRFAGSEILYGHLKNGQFVLDHSDKISLLDTTAAGGFRVQAEASSGVRYTYQTSESDENVLEYYETWQEEHFPETYRGGASLSRSS